jgi:hypothetical protein
VLVTSFVGAQRVAGSSEQRRIANGASEVMPCSTLLVHHGNTNQLIPRWFEPPSPHVSVQLDWPPMYGGALLSVHQDCLY